MKKTIIMAVTIDGRDEHAPKVQQILTEHGCIIKTRIGLHETEEDSCSPKGLILLQIFAEKPDVEALENELTSVEGVHVNKMDI